MGGKCCGKTAHWHPERCEEVIGSHRPPETKVPVIGDYGYRKGLFFVESGINLAKGKLFQDHFPFGRDAIKDIANSGLVEKEAKRLAGALQNVCSRTKSHFPAPDRITSRFAISVDLSSPYPGSLALFSRLASSFSAATYPFSCALRESLPDQR
jgi:hypothetical protein